MTLSILALSQNSFQALSNHFKNFLPNITSTMLLLSLLLASLTSYSVLADIKQADTTAQDSQYTTDAVTARVLITGFEPFGGYDYNPSGDVAQALAGTCMNYTFIKNHVLSHIYTCFDGWVLPVNSTGSSTVSNILLSGEPFLYDAVLHLGLEDVAKGLKLETFAVNQLAEPDGTEPVSFCYNNSDYDQPTGMW